MVNKDMTNKKRALIITWERFQDHEAIYPYYSLKEHGFEVDVMGNKIGRLQGDLGAFIDCNMLTSSIDRESFCNDLVDSYELLVIPGGVKALEKLRQEKGVIQIVKKWNLLNKTIFVICNGAQLLISADILRGRKVAGYYSIEPDIVNAGAEYPKEDVCIDKNIVSAKHYKDMGEWLRKGFTHHEIRKYDHLLTNSA